MPKPRIAVIGELMWDKYWIGEATRLSPEAPVPVVKILETKELMGGAGNVVMNLRALGAEAPLYHTWAKEIGLQTIAHMPVKNRLMVGPVQLARWDEYDRVEAFWPDDHPNLPKPGALDNVDVVIISDYGKGAFAITTAVQRVLGDFSGPILVDTKQDPKHFFGWNNDPRVTFFPNRAEATAFRQSYATCKCVYKLGPDGIEYNKVRYPSKVKDLVSVNGAGDTVIAAYAYKIATGAGPVEAIDFALAAAAVVCAKPLTATASVSEIWRFENDH